MNIYMYRLYLDEHGVDRMTRVDEDKFRFLSLTGVVMKVDHARDYLVPALNSVKSQVLNEDPDSPICLHRSDIRQSKGPFECLKAPKVRELFDQRILRIIREADYVVITALVDKYEMSDKNHWEQTHPYHVLMEVMIEKYVQLLKRKSAIGDVMPEARGNKQDKALQSEFETFKTNGTRFASAKLVQDRIPSNQLKFRTKKNCIAGLQLCDLLAHPSHYAIRKRLGHTVIKAPFGNAVSNILIKHKYDRSDYGKIWGYGAKALP